MFVPEGDPPRTKTFDIPSDTVPSLVVSVLSACKVLYR